MQPPTKFPSRWVPWCVRCVLLKPWLRRKADSRPLSLQQFCSRFHHSGVSTALLSQLLILKNSDAWGLYFFRTRKLVLFKIHPCLITIYSLTLNKISSSSDDKFCLTNLQELMRLYLGIIWGAHPVIFWVPIIGLARVFRHRGLQLWTHYSALNNTSVNSGQRRWQTMPKI